LTQLPPAPAQPYGPHRAVEPPSLRYTHRSFRSVNGLGTAVSILICLVALAQAVLAASEWYTYKVVKDYVEGPVKDPDRLDRADEVVVLAVGGWALALLAAGVVFIVWLWRARGNAELFCYGQHRRGRGWVIGGWFCPVVNFWFPKQIVDDVIAASDPRTPPLFPDLRRIPRHGLVLAWWLTWVATMVRGNVGNPDLAADVQDVSDRVLGASVSTVGAVLTAVAAVLAIRVVRLVGRLQMSRSWTPWWATDPSTEPQLWPAQHLQQIQGASVTTPYGQGPQQPYGQQPYGAPQMGYPAAAVGVKPNNYLAWSIVSIFLFWPLGIAAIINATKVDPAWQMGNAAMAQEHSNKAKMFSMIATIIGAVGFVIYFIIGWRFGLSLFGSE
jgi:predicted secreted protein